MRRTFAVLVLTLAWFVGFATLSLAWGQTAEPATTVAVPAAGGSFVVNLSDLTFPGAVFLGFWILARNLPMALRAWSPTLRVELVQRDRDPGEPGR